MIHLPKQLATLGEEPSPREVSVWRIAVFGTLCFTFYFGLIKQLERGVWYDEALTTFFISLEWSDLFSLMAQYEANMGLYYVLLKIWSSISDSELWLRLFSLAAHLGTGAILYHAAKRYLGTRAAYFFLAMFFTHYLLVRYSVEIRGYALATLLITAMWAAWAKLAFEKNERWWLAYTAIGVFAIHTHLLVSIAIFFLGTSLLLKLENRKGLYRWMLSHFLIATSFLPLLVFALTRESGQLSWLSTPELKSLLYAAIELSGISGNASPALRYSAILLIFVFSTAILTQDYLFTKKLQTGKNQNLQGSLMIAYSGGALLAGMLVGTFAISHIEPAFSVRFFVPYVPLLLFSMANISSLAKITPLKYLAGIIPLIFVFSTLSYNDRYNIGWSSAHEVITDNCDSIEAIVHLAPSTQSAFNFYNKTKKGCLATRLPYHLDKDNYLKEYNLDVIQWDSRHLKGRFLVVVSHTDYSISDVMEHYKRLNSGPIKCEAKHLSPSIDIFVCNVT